MTSHAPSPAAAAAAAASPTGVPVGFGERRLILCCFTLYETRTKFYIVASDQCAINYRVLHISRTVPLPALSVTDDKVVYTKSEVAELLAMVEDGNRNVGGLKKVMGFHGLFGFVRFLEGWYMILITKRSPVALLGGHAVYHVDDTLILPIVASVPKADRRIEEQRYFQIFCQIDTSKNFYYSYSYELTQTLQNNILFATQGPPPGITATGATVFPCLQPNAMFMWNHHLITPAFPNLASPWAIPVIHGFVDQCKISIYGHILYITLIGRRSRFFAGARFLKRGLNDEGYVANDVETEQIVADATTSALFNPHHRECGRSPATSFVQHRGSIPLYWSQENTNLAPKPPIQLDVVDPFCAAAALHFDHLLHRYGGPIIILNLIKRKEKIKRESLLMDEFAATVSYLNQHLPPKNQMRYIAWDMARASKSPDQDVIGVLEAIAEQVLRTTGFFHAGPEPYALAQRRGTPVNRVMERRQSGVARTNCIDCLDRTNAAQFMLGKCALGHQLCALGVLPNARIPFDCDIINMLNAMYHDHGDTIALQYGGSHLVNTMETYRKISLWTPHSRDMIESIRRYYSNSFTDAEKQDAINLFLGVYRFDRGLPHLWELSNDYFLHNPPKPMTLPRRSYRQWWTASLDGPSLTALYEAPPVAGPFTALSPQRSLAPTLESPHTDSRDGDGDGDGDGHHASTLAAPLLALPLTLGLHTAPPPAARLGQSRWLLDWFNDYYKAYAYSSLSRLLAFKMVSADPSLVHADSSHASPFIVRGAGSDGVGAGGAGQAGRSPTGASESGGAFSPNKPVMMIYSLNIGGVKRWLALSDKTSGSGGVHDGSSGSLAATKAAAGNNGGGSGGAAGSIGSGDPDPDVYTGPGGVKWYNHGAPSRAGTPQFGLTHPLMPTRRRITSDAASVKAVLAASSPRWPGRESGTTPATAAAGAGPAASPMGTRDRVLSADAAPPGAAPLPSSLAWWSTAAVAQRLLQAQVPSAELREYRRYVNQYRAPPLASTRMSRAEWRYHRGLGQGSLDVASLAAASHGPLRGETSVRTAHRSLSLVDRPVPSDLSPSSLHHVPTTASPDARDAYAAAWRSSPSLLSGGMGRRGSAASTSLVSPSRLMRSSDPLDRRATLPLATPRQGRGHGHGHGHDPMAATTDDDDGEADGFDGTAARRRRSVSGTPTRLPAARATVASPSDPPSEANFASPPPPPPPLPQPLGSRDRPTAPRRAGIPWSGAAAPGGPERGARGAPASPVSPPAGGVAHGAGDLPASRALPSAAAATNALVPDREPDHGHVPFHRETHPDHAFFASYLAKFAAEPIDALHAAAADLGAPSSRDTLLYESYVHTMGATESFVLNHAVRGRQETARYEGYARWLATGKFVRHATAATTARAQAHAQAHGQTPSTAAMAAMPGAAAAGYHPAAPPAPSPSMAGGDAADPTAGSLPRRYMRGPRVGS